MTTLVLLITLFVPAQAQSKPQPATTVTGKWTMTLEMQMGTATPALELKQDGEKLTGTYAGRYGKFELTGTIKNRELEFSFKMTAEGEEVLMRFRGGVSPDYQVMKGEADMAGAGDASWTAKRAQDLR